MIKYLVSTKDSGLTTLDTFPCRKWVKELCEGRQFESLQQLQTILMVVDVSKEAYDRGLGCPKDARNAIEIIESLPKFTATYAIVTCKESERKLHDMVNEMFKQGKILTSGRIGYSIELDHWTVEVVTKIELEV